MNKVTYEITKNGWITTVVFNEKTYSEKYEFIDGVAVCIEGNLDKEGLPEDLLKSVVTIDEYNVMYALQKF